MSSVFRWLSPFALTLFHWFSQHSHNPYNLYFVISSLRAWRTVQAIIVYVKSENLIIFSLFPPLPKLNCPRPFVLLLDLCSCSPTTVVVRISTYYYYSIPFGFSCTVQSGYRGLFFILPDANRNVASHCQIPANHNGKRFARKRQHKYCALVAAYRLYGSIHSIFITVLCVHSMGWAKSGWPCATIASGRNYLICVDVRFCWMLLLCVCSARFAHIRHDTDSISQR